MKKTLNQILMDEARQTELHEWMKTVQVTVGKSHQTDPQCLTHIAPL